MALPTNVLSLTSAVGLSTAWTASYVASVYLLPATRVSSSSAAAPPTPTTTARPQGTAGDPLSAETTPDLSPIVEQPRDRNHPSIIKARLTCVSLATVLSAASVPFLINRLSIGARDIVLPRTSLLLGMAVPSSLGDAARLVLLPLGLTMSLFAGSLYVTYLAECMPGQRWWSPAMAWREFGGWQGLRNLILVSRRAEQQGSIILTQICNASQGPLTEEVVFRSCIVPVSALAGMSKTQIIFLSPLYFGLGRHTRLSGVVTFC